MRINKFKLNSFTALLSHTVTIVLGLILPRLILENYGTEINGLTQSIKHFLGAISFLDLGVGQVIRSELYSPLKNNNLYEISCILDSGTKFYRKLAGILVVYVIFLMFTYPLLAKTVFPFIYTAALIAIISISNFSQYYFGIVNMQLLHADQKSYLIYFLQIVTNILNFVISVLIILLNGSIHIISLATSMIFIIRPVALNFYVRKNYKIEKNVKYTGEPVSQKWNGIAQHISAVVLDGTDIIVLTIFADLLSVSVYSVYYLVINSIQQIYQAATASIHSVAGMLWAGNEIKEIKSMYSKVELALHIVTVFLFTCTAVLILPFVTLYTEKMNEPLYIQPLFAAILVVAYGIRCLRTPYNIWILAAGHYRQTQSSHITAAVLNIVISVIFVVKYGLVGVAIGTLVAMVYQTLWMAVYTARNLIKVPLKSVVKQFGTDLLIVGIVLVLYRKVSFTPHSYLEWTGMAVVVALLIAGVLLAVKCVFYKGLIKETVDRYLKKRTCL